MFKYLKPVHRTCTAHRARTGAQHDTRARTAYKSTRPNAQRGQTLVVESWNRCAYRSPGPKNSASPSRASGVELQLPLPRPRRGTEHQKAMSFWWLRRRSRPSSKRKDGPVPASASASCSPRHSVVVPPTAYASASASPSAQWERAWTRSLVSLAPRGAADRAAAAAVTLCGGGGSGPGGATAGLGRALPLPRPVYKLAPVSSGSSSDSDEVVDNTNFRYKMLHLRGIRAGSQLPSLP